MRRFSCSSSSDKCVLPKEKVASRDHFALQVTDWHSPLSSRAIPVAGKADQRPRPVLDLCCARLLADGLHDRWTRQLKRLLPRFGPLQRGVDGRLTTGVKPHGGDVERRRAQVSVRGEQGPAQLGLTVAIRVGPAGRFARLALGTAVRGAAACLDDGTRRVTQIRAPPLIQGCLTQVRVQEPIQSVSSLPFDFPRGYSLFDEGPVARIKILAGSSMRSATRVVRHWEEPRAQSVWTRLARIAKGHAGELLIRRFCSQGAHRGAATKGRGGCG
mmetsp:Transcript_3211/g.10824  ORF Transcript_3211/g.10824 Transcript_3211/m.10824 type:complete len:272 (+) Transcript_3211:286-1101(+)